MQEAGGGPAFLGRDPQIWASGVKDYHELLAWSADFDFSVILSVLNLKLINVKLVNVKLENVKLANVKLENVKLVNVKLANVKLANVKLANVKLENVKLANVKLIINYIDDIFFWLSKEAIES